MANKTDGITDLTNVLIDASKNFNDKQFKRLQGVIFAMLHGVNYGYTTLDGRFLEDSNDLQFIHKADKAFKKIKKIKKRKHKNNVIHFKDYVREAVEDDGG